MKKPEVLLEYTHARVDILIKVKGREEKIKNLEELRKSLDISEYPPGDYNHIINYVKIIISSKNSKIQILALKCLLSLVRGLKWDFPDPLSFFPICVQ